MAVSEARASERGALLFAIGGCTNCHTAKDGAELAGGDPIHSPFGTFYAPNITPDAETGIGGWSDEDFIRAMREGVSPEGDPYYPAFPFTSYTRMTEADLRELKAHLDTLEPVRQEAQDHVLRLPVWPNWRIPFDPRPALWGWHWLFFEPEAFVPDSAQDDTWNRGAYLVEGPGHCGECHTPRNLFGALDLSRAYEGNPHGAGDEVIPSILPDKDGIGDWSEADLMLFLQLGMMPDGDFAGSEMAKIIDNGTSKLVESDRAAIVRYLEAIPAN